MRANRRSFILDLQCSRCGRIFDHSKIQSICTSCGGTLFSTYDIEKAKSAVSKSDLRTRAASLWRYYEMLPLLEEANIVSLGEGFTSIIDLASAKQKLNCGFLSMKDDGTIPTGTFKARGMSTAISKAKELGIKKVALASAGNAGAAASTYSARAGLECFVFMPRDAPESTKKECEQMGANLRLVNGLINDAAKFVINGKERFGWFELSTLKEPYRIEGKKTMGYEIAEQLDWKLPDIIIYPTGGGTGLIGMWKAFQELKLLGWTDHDSALPRMVAVQSSGCAPVVKAFEEKRESAEPFPNPNTIAGGIRVPSPYASEQILKVLKQSRGMAVKVDDKKILGSMKTLAKVEGLFVCPEGATTYAALEQLLEDGWVDNDERILLYNTGTGLKYLELFDLPESRILAPDDYNGDL